MLIRILSFLLESIFFVLIAAALLRAWMNWTRVNMRGQPGVFVMAVTDWCVKPLRLALPKAVAQAKIDWASLLTALIFALAYAVIWLVLFTMVLGGLGDAANASNTEFGTVLPGSAPKDQAGKAMGAYLRSRKIRDGRVRCRKGR